MSDKKNDKGNDSDKGNRLTTSASLVLLSIGLYFLFVSVDAWAVKAFARPILAAALIAAIDIALFIVVLALAPSLSKIVGLVTRRS